MYVAGVYRYPIFRSEIVTIELACTKEIQDGPYRDDRGLDVYYNRTSLTFDECKEYCAYYRPIGKNQYTLLPSGDLEVDDASFRIVGNVDIPNKSIVTRANGESYEVRENNFLTQEDVTDLVCKSRGRVSA